MINIIILDGICVNPKDLSFDKFKSLGKLTVYDRTAYSEIIEKAKDADIILTNKCTIDKFILDNLPNLKYIGALATGYNNIDADYAKKLGIVVTNVPSYSTESVVQSIFAFLLSITNQVAEHNASVKAGDWCKSKDFCYYLSELKELNNQTLAIIGYGQIGKRVADVALAFGLNLIVYDNGRTRIGTERVHFSNQLETVVSNADIVVLCCPLTLTNAKMINRQLLDKFKDKAILINTSRGGLIDEVALKDALISGKIYAAGVDVLSTEPPTPDNPLLAAPNIIITPHIAWATRESRSRLIDIAAANIKSYLDNNTQNWINQ